MSAIVWGGTHVPQVWSLDCIQSSKKDEIREDRLEFGGAARELIRS